jgi:hypothetical protein
MLIFPSFFNAQVGGYEIEQSLRFDGSAYLSRSLGTTSSSWTVSFWTKNGLNDNNDGYWFNTSQAAIYMDSSSGAASDRRYKFRDASSGSLIVSNAVIRDPSAWYHVVYKCDGSNRRLYINNSLDAGFTYSGSTTLSGSCAIGAYYTGSGSQLEGYIAEFHLVDGSALDPDQFAELDDNGVWRPIAYTGSHGTNGFYLTFDPSATNGIGHDHSGNGNNWTTSGFTTSGTGTDVFSDTPTTNWCTANPLAETGANISILDGNLVVNATASGDGAVDATIAVPSSGKFYVEATLIQVTGGINQFRMGLQPTNDTAYSRPGTNTDSYGFRWNDSAGLFAAYDEGTETSYGTGTAVDGDVVGIAIDRDNGEIKTHINNTYFNSGNAVITGIPTTGDYLFRISVDGGASKQTGATLNFGQRAFAYTPPTGFKALNTANLAAPTVKDGSEYFNTVLWTGNGSSQSITGVGFQPDLVWGKSRNNTYNNALEDSVRGVSRWLGSNSTLAETYVPGTEVTSFDTDGFSLGTGGIYNASSTTYVGWNWKAGGAGGSSNTDGSITSTVSANPSAGFSIVSWTGNATAGATVGHGLGVAPAAILVKNRDDAADWKCYFSALGNTKGLQLNKTSSVQIATELWNNTSPTSTVFSLGTNNSSNGNNNNMIAYCFSEVEGYSKFGSYTGNGSSDGPFVYCGFRPAWLMIKSSSNVTNWYVFDTARNEYNLANKSLFPNLANQENTGGNEELDIVSNGFKMRNASSSFNINGYTYIFAAFAEHPFGGSGVSPATAR